MAGTSDLIAAGLGSWSTVSRLITKGLGIATPTPPLDAVIEYTLTDTRTQWTTSDSRIEWTLEGPD